MSSCQMIGQKLQVAVVSVPLCWCS